MKETWKCFKVGLSTIAAQSGSMFSMTGAMTTAMREYRGTKTTQNNDKYRL